MNMKPQLRFLPEKWELFQAFYPSLFLGGNDLKFGLRAQEVLAPLEGRPIGESFGYVISRLVTDFPDHFVDRTEVERLGWALACFEIDPMRWSVSVVGRKGLITQRTDLTAREQRTFDHIRSWARENPIGRLPLFDTLFRGHSRVKPDMSVVTSLLFKLEPGIREPFFETVNEGGLARRLKIPADLRVLIDAEIASIKLPSSGKREMSIFDDPQRVLRRLVGAMERVEPDWYANVYLSAFIHEMADVEFLLSFAAALPNEKGLIAPEKLPSLTETDWFSGFMGRQGFDEERFALWFDAVSHREPQVVDHLTIAFSSRLRPYFERTMKQLGRGKYYEELLSAVSDETGLGIEGLDAWLSWKYSGDDRKMLGSYLRERTMMLDWQCDAMRKLPRMPMEPTTEYERVVQALGRVRNAFTSTVGVQIRREKIWMLLAEFGINPDNLWDRIDRWFESGMVYNTFAFIDMVLSEVGIKRPKKKNGGGNGSSPGSSVPPASKGFAGEFSSDRWF